MGDCYGVSVDRIEKVLLAANEEIIRLNQALAEKDQQIERWKNLSRDEHVRLLAESKEHLLQQYVNLTQMYGEQKHEIRRLTSAIAEKDREIEVLKKRVQRKPEEWESVCGECNGSGWR